MQYEFTKLMIRYSSVPLTEQQPGARRDETRAGAAIDKI